MQEQNNKAPHILNTSSNLLGICFIVLTSLKVFGKMEQTLVDEIAMVVIILLMSSCLLSFLSIRHPAGKHKRLESVADIVFISALVLLFTTTILLSLQFI